MHCPNCGTRSSMEQKFCRSCGLRLEKFVQELVEQLPTLAQEDRPVSVRRAQLLEQQRKVERGLTGLLGGAFAICMLALILGVIYKMIFTNGELVKGSLVLAFLITAAIALLRVFYRESLRHTPAEQVSAETAQLQTGASDRLLPEEPHLEPVASVTEQTTELLFVEKKGRA